MIKREVAEAKTAVLRLAQIIVQRQGGILTDAEALTAPAAFEPWAANRPYDKGQIVQHKGLLYRLMADVDKSQEHQPPDADGMLAIYRPIVPTASGELDDPIPYVYGMDCTAGLYYIYNEAVYLCEGDMLPCVWPPDSGIWQWTRLEDANNG